MPKRKGLPKTGGRTKGAPNKVTADVRATIALIAERNIGMFEQWLFKVAEDDPSKAADLFLKSLEYHIPKLARTELTGKGGGPIDVTINVVGIEPASRR